MLLSQILFTKGISVSVSKTLLIALCMGSIAAPTAAMQENGEKIAFIASGIIFSACGGTSLIATKLNVWTLEEKKAALLVEIAKTKSAKEELSGLSRKRRAAERRLILKLEEEQKKELKSIDASLKVVSGSYFRNACAGGCLGLVFTAFSLVNQQRSVMMNRYS